MITDIGEYIVGAYLKLILECDFIDYNVRPPGGGMKGLEELDVIGLNFKNNTAYLCEVSTHTRGLVYGKSSNDTVERIKKKHVRQKQYAEKYLKQFGNKRFMFWSPVVSKKKLSEELGRIPNLELYINGKYKQSIKELKALAKRTTHDAKNPFFRMLQIIEHLRD